MNRLQMLIPPLPWQGPRIKPGSGDRVVLLHGLWRGVWAMEAPARHLNQAGLETVTVPYSSFRKTLDEIVEEVAEAVRGSDKITHFVTHSMGGIVFRCLASRYPDLITGKVVMLAPPNQGSEIIDWLEDSWIGKWSLGPGGISLSTKRVPEEIPDLDAGLDVAVIMGSRSPFSLFNFLLASENDGIVTVEGGKIPGINRFDVVEVDHTFIMGDASVLQQTSDFLLSRDGSDLSSELPSGD